MSIVVRFNPTALTAEKYDETIRRLTDAGDFPPDGLDYHGLFRLRWQSQGQRDLELQQQFAAFGERLMPLLADVGIGFSGAPEIFEVHNILKR